MSTFLNPVVFAPIQKGGFEQTAVHHHLLHESPRVFYMHVHGRGDPLKLAATRKDAIGHTKMPPPARANDDASKLATGLRAALDVTKSQKPTAR